MTGPTPRDILELTHGLQQDLRSGQAKLVTIRSWLAAQPHEKRRSFPCPSCGSDLATERALAFHLQNVHDGPPVPLSPEEAIA